MHVDRLCGCAWHQYTAPTPQSFPSTTSDENAQKQKGLPKLRCRLRGTSEALLLPLPAFSGTSVSEEAIFIFQCVA